MNYNDLTKEELIKLLEDNESYSGKYGLIWDKEKEPEKIVEECDKNIPILNEITEKRIINGGTNNLLIEGDNFHALSILNYTHQNKIDIIYIDPPYNTKKSDEWIYNDKYVDADDAYKHSKWLNFMDKRLKIARNILKENGLIFISIDDNELCQLKLLCDKIFGENNFCGQYMWYKSATPPNLSKKIKKNLEYVLCYEKSKDDVKFKGIVKNSSSNNGLMNQTNSIGILNFPPNVVDTNLQDGLYEKGLYGTSKYEIELLEDTEVKDHLFIKNVKLKGKFKWSQQYLDSEISKGTKISIKTIAFSPSYEKLEYDPEVPTNLIDKNVGVNTTEEAGKELAKLFDGKMVFEYPKHVSLIKYLIKFIDNKDAIILDFFAGSGTTGQAVLELNKEDGGHRQFILCTNNENNICEEITYERLKRVICGYKEFNALGGCLEYYKCDFVENSNNRDQLYFDLTEKCIPMMCVKDNNFIEYKTTDEYKIFTNKDKISYSCVYYSLFGDKEEEFVKELENINGYKSIYKFSLGETVDTSIFEKVKDYSIEAIPYKIVELYKRIVKMSRED